MQNEKLRRGRGENLPFPKGEGYLVFASLPQRGRVMDSRGRLSLRFVPRSHFILHSAFCILHWRFAPCAPFAPHFAFRISHFSLRILHFAFCILHWRSAPFALLTFRSFYYRIEEKTMRTRLCTNTRYTLIPLRRASAPL